MLGRAIIFGVSSAWVISRYDFAGRAMLEWMLLLPAAIPAYIIAYCYTDFLNMPVQCSRRCGRLLGGKAREIIISPKFGRLAGSVGHGIGALSIFIW